MDSVQSLLEVQERLYTLRDEMAQRRQHMSLHGSDSAILDRHMLNADQQLARIEAGLYPVCTACGERVEIARLQQDALAQLCAACAQRAPSGA
jgi:RNA polymerase-binding transcription factor DksA